ncbi:hypothetical protein F5148DRAFT_1156409 [Russula earlei]|uniref:Uncharacterized protein n=1 Tax=Russula earlei TaxID=71964 RepID=A0ACC0URW1_9AGAM|nr:hypothetical protein F5148DRAFT_1156409 [Russula earlei]
MSIFCRVSLVIVAIAAPALAMGEPGHNYYPSYYPPHNPYKQDSPPDKNDHSGGANVNVLAYHQSPTTTPSDARPTYVPPAYAPPAYGPPAAYTPPIYHPPTGPDRRPAVRPEQGYNPMPDYPSYREAYESPVDTPAYKPPENQGYRPPSAAPAYKPPTEDQPYTPYSITPAYQPPAENQAYTPPSDTVADKPPAEINEYNTNGPITSAPPAEIHPNPPMEETPTVSPQYSPTYDEPSPPKWGYGKPSPLPNYKDRRNVQRVSRHKVGKAAKSTSQREGHTRRFLKKRQQGGQHAVVPVTVNLITGVGHAPSTSSAATAATTNALPPSQSPISPGVKVDSSQAALSLHSNPEATMPSVGAMTPPVSSSSSGQKPVNLDTGEPGNKAAVIASILSIIIGLVVIITVVKLTSNVMRKRKHAKALGQYDEHLSSKEGLIPNMSEQRHFETHDVIITSPDGSEISPLSPGRDDSPSPPPFGARVVGCSLPPVPMPTFAPPPTPASPLSLPYAKLLSPTVNLAQQNLIQSRTSATSETMSVSTTSTDISERRSASDGEGLGRQLSHRRMRSAPGSVVWSARSSSATGKLTSGMSGEEGYWESVDVCGSESVGRMVCRLSRARSVAMSVMW